MPAEARILKRSTRDPAIIRPGHLGVVPKSLYDPEDMIAYIREELMYAEQERSDIEDLWARMHEVYDAPMPTEPKNHPFTGASNLTVPLAKEMVNTLQSSLAQTTLVQRPAFIFKDLAEEWTPFKHLIETFMDLASRREFDMEKAVSMWILEAAKMGTSVLETAYRYEEGLYPKYVSDNEVVLERRARKDGPDLRRIPLQDFFIRMGNEDVQEAPWVSKRFRLSRRQLEAKRFNDQWDKEVIELLLERSEDNVTNVDEVREQIEEQMLTEPVLRQKWTFHEMWLRWKLKGQDTDVELVATYHPDTQELVRVGFHPYWHQQRPFHALVYFPVEDQFYGDGLCRQLEAIQLELSTQHNQRIDNATLANMRMWSVRRGVRGLKPGDKLYAGKIVYRNEQDDIVPMQMGDIYGSTIANEQVTRGYAERISAVTEAQSRGGFPVTRTTATAQRDLLQEQAKRFDQVIRAIRGGQGDIGAQVLSLYFQFGDAGKAQLWLGDKGRIVQAIFNLPSRASELGMGLEASAPTSRLNKEQEKENMIALYNLQVSMWGQLLPLVGQFLPPESLPIVANTIVASAEKFMTRTLEQFDQTDPEDTLAGLAVLQRLLPKPEDLGGLESFERAERDSEVLGQLERLEAILRQAEGNGAGQPRVPGRNDNVRRFSEEARLSGRGSPSPRFAGGTPPGA